MFKYAIQFFPSKVIKGRLDSVCKFYIFGILIYRRQVVHKYPFKFPPAPPKRELSPEIIIEVIKFLNDKGFISAFNKEEDGTSIFQKILAQIKRTMN
ncbi:hypothetical protein CMU30_14080 [Elizabethkingia anophelis]|nr:hypothetical protein [Elizabethkingia anophelis]MDV3684408.1 hypothetical protein [Elizabethkingia anophelis]MDV3699751.1 hypothetical protein [Elizabethkingia anophelis]MDV3763595.1 hypothetical protein [Elizabethkingia anophelis]MDV3802669.1 hypothetical protein [Elizabethkingia anophelis]